MKNTRFTATDSLRRGNVSKNSNSKNYIYISPYLCFIIQAFKFKIKKTQCINIACKIERV